MYVGDEGVIEAVWNDVVLSRLEDWSYPKMSWVAALRVTSATPEIRAAAVAFAKEQKGKAYDLALYQKDAAGNSWFCSELVWAAYLNASGGQIDISGQPDLYGVSPTDIYDNEDTEVIAGHYEKNPQGMGNLITSMSPVDLEVVDPAGRLVSKETFEIPAAVYGEDDEDGDGSPHDWIGIPEPLAGQYSVTVIAEPGALPTDTFTLAVVLENGTTTTLAEDVQIADIPSEPYVYVSSLAVGGIAELPEVAGAPFEDSTSPARNAGVLAGLSAGGALLLAGGARYARRRWLRHRA
jgi:hypothetical protein